MAVNRKDEGKNGIEFERGINALKDDLKIQLDQKDGEITELNTTITSMEARIAVLEGYFTGVIDNDINFICNDADTYDSGTSELLTIENGLIKGIG